MTEDEKQLSRECGDNMEDTHETKWTGFTIPTKGKYSFGSVTLELDMRPYTQNELIELAYAQATKDIMERWPAYVDMQLAAPQIGRDQSQWHACYVWLKSKLFPEDEVK